MFCDYKETKQKKKYIYIYTCIHIHVSVYARVRTIKMNSVKREANKKFKLK